MQNQRTPFISAGILLAISICLPATPVAAEQSSITPAKRTGAFYDRFEKINQRIQANQGNVDLIFVGDSITHGWEGPGRDVWNDYYSDRKAQNLGVNGDRTENVLWRLDNGNIDGIQPKVAVLMIGINNSWGDSAGEIVAGINAVVIKLRERLPETKILLLDILPSGKTFNQKRGILLQVNQTVRKLEDGENIFYLAIGHHFLNGKGGVKRSLMHDYVHPSTAGYGVWARQMEDTLAALLGDESKASSSGQSAAQN